MEPCPKQQFLGHTSSPKQSKVKEQEQSEVKTPRVDKPAVRVRPQAKFIKERHKEFDNTLREDFNECHGKDVSQSVLYSDIA